MIIKTQIQQKNLGSAPPADQADQAQMVGHDDHLGREVPLFHIRPFPLVG